MIHHVRRFPAARFAATAAFALLAIGPAAQAGPVLRLPGAGRVVATNDTLVRDGFDQRIQFSGGAGTNAANLALRTQTADLVLAFPANLARPNRAGIDAEIAALFPGQILRVLPVPRRNAYGPVGMAVGADCLYAWQWIDLTPAMMQASGRPRLFGALSRPDPIGALSLRIRLCRTEQASLPDLIAAVESMRLDLVARPRADVGIAPAGTEPTRIRRRPRPVAGAETARRERATPPRPVEARTRPEPAPKAGAVPEAAGRRFIAPAPSNEAVAAPVTRPVPGAVPGPAPGGRYITDVIQQPEAPARGVPTPAPNPVGRPTGGEAVSSDLPAQAYRPGQRSPR